MSDTLLGVIVGGLLATAAGAVTEYFRGRRESRLDKDKRADDRRLAHDMFQRETLIRLQDALVDWARVEVVMHMADVRAFRETGAWGKNVGDEELSSAELAANRNLSLLRSRVDDDGLRARLGVCQDISFQILMATNQQRVDELSRDLAPIVNESLARAGELVRGLW